MYKYIYMSKITMDAHQNKFAPMIFFITAEIRFSFIKVDQGRVQFEIFPAVRMNLHTYKRAFDRIIKILKGPSISLRHIVLTALWCTFGFYLMHQVIRQRSMTIYRYRPWKKIEHPYSMEIQQIFSGNRVNFDFP